LNKERFTEELDPVICDTKVNPTPLLRLLLRIPPLMMMMMMMIVTFV